MSSFFVCQLVYDRWQWREKKWWSRWDGQWTTVMLLKQRVSGYWEHTAPKVTRNGEAIGESNRGVSTLLSRQMKWSLLLVGVWRWDDSGWLHRAVGNEDPMKPNDSRSPSLEKTRPNMWENFAVPLFSLRMDSHRGPSLVYTVTLAR